MKRIILGSASPRRKELLEQIGIPFEIRTSDKEERFSAEKAEDVVQELALMKAENVASELEENRDVLVIGADTVVVLDGQILGKPKDEADACNMLKHLQGKTHQVYTGVALLDLDEDGAKQIHSYAVETKVHVCPMDEREIARYVATKEPMDKAGAYGIQGKFAAYIEGIEGDYYNVVGLPIASLYKELKNMGIMD